jgi:Protein of unknown function (DUF4232)
MINGFRRTAAAAVSVLALGAGGAAWAASSASAASAAPAAPAAISRCLAGNLAVWVNADSADGTAGTTYFTLDYTNTGRTTCSLFGFPGVSATTLGGAQIGKAATRNNATPYKVINIAPGATAHSNLGYHDIVIEPSCKERTPAFLKVYAPNDTVAKHAFFSLTVCATGQSDFSVMRVQAGA